MLLVSIAVIAITIPSVSVVASSAGATTDAHHKVSADINASVKAIESQGWKLVSEAFVQPQCFSTVDHTRCVFRYELTKTQVGSGGKYHTGHLTVTQTASTGGVIGCVLGIAGDAALVYLSGGASAVVGISEAEFLGACGIGAWTSKISSWLGG